MSDDTKITHRCRYGTVFSGRADLKDGVLARGWEGLSYGKMMADFVQFGAWHALNIHPTLTSFAGYDTVTFVADVEK